MVMVSNGGEVRRLIQSHKTFEYSDVIIGERVINAIDFDPNDKLVYWVDTATRQVKRYVYNTMLASHRHKILVFVSLN